MEGKRRKVRCPALNKDHKSKYNSRCSPGHFVDTVRTHVIGNQSRVRKLDEVGFGQLLKISCLSLQKLLCEWICTNFDHEEGKLIVGPNSAPIQFTESDVERILGIPLGDRPVKTSGPLEDVEALMTELRLVLKKGYKTVFDWDQVLDYLCNEEADDKFVQYFLIYAIGILLDPNTQRSISVSILHSLREVGGIRHMNWCRYVWRSTIDGIKSWQESVAKKAIEGKEQVTYAKGCQYVLMIWYLDKTFVEGCNVTPTLPLCAVWKEHAIGTRLQYEMQNFGRYGLVQAAPPGETDTGPSSHFHARQDGHDVGSTSGHGIHINDPEGGPIGQGEQLDAMDPEGPNGSFARDTAVEGNTSLPSPTVDQPPCPCFVPEVPHVPQSSDILRKVKEYLDASKYHARMVDLHQAQYKQKMELLEEQLRIISSTPTYRRDVLTNLGVESVDPVRVLPDSGINLSASEKTHMLHTTLPNFVEQEGTGVVSPAASGLRGSRVTRSVQARDNSLLAQEPCPANEAEVFALQEETVMFAYGKSTECLMENERQTTNLASTEVEKDTMAANPQPLSHDLGTEGKQTSPNSTADCSVEFLESKTNKKTLDEVLEDKAAMEQECSSRASKRKRPVSRSAATKSPYMCTHRSKKLIATPSMKACIKKFMDSSIDPDTIVCHVSKYKLEKEYLMQLTPTHWIGTTVIHVFCILFNNDDAKIFARRRKLYFMPDATEDLVNTNIVVKKEKQLAELCVPIACFAEIADLATAQMLFFPIFYGKHWFVYVINIRDGRIDILDCLNSDRQLAKCNTILKNLINAVAYLLRKVNHKKADTIKSLKRIRAEVPRSDTGQDCGVWTIAYMNLWDGHLTSPLDLDHIDGYRWYYLGKLLESPLNEVRCALVEGNK